MAVEVDLYTVSKASLDSVANAIRSKGETTDLLRFPDGFSSAIQAIPGVDSLTTAEGSKF